MKIIKNPKILWEFLIQHSCGNPHFITNREDYIYFKCSNCNEEYFLEKKDLDFYELVMDQEIQDNHFLINYLKTPFGRVYLLQRVHYFLKTKTK